VGVGAGDQAAADGEAVEAFFGAAPATE